MSWAAAREAAGLPGSGGGSVSAVRLPPGDHDASASSFGSRADRNVHEVAQQNDRSPASAPAKVQDRVPSSTEMNGTIWRKFSSEWISSSQRAITMPSKLADFGIAARTRARRTPATASSTATATRTSGSGSVPDGIVRANPITVSIAAATSSATAPVMPRPGSGPVATGRQVPDIGDHAWSGRVRGRGRPDRTPLAVSQRLSSSAGTTSPAALA